MTTRPPGCWPVVRLTLTHYDGVHAVAEALKEADLPADVDPTEASPKLAEAMTKITVKGLTGTLTWNDKGEVQKDPTAYVIKDGKYVQA